MRFSRNFVRKSRSAENEYGIRNFAGIGHYYDGYDDTSAESEDTAESDDPSSE